jgi:hypothetical protein
MTAAPFEFPPSLQPKHIEELRKRGISPEFAIASSVRSAADNELRRLNFEASLPVDQRKQGLQGLCFEYRDPWTGGPLTWRLRPDARFDIDGKPAKYLSRLGDSLRPFFPHTTTAELLADPKAEAIITEGEFKALAIAENLGPLSKKPLAVIGLAGVNGGWHREKRIVAHADGGHEKKSFGAPRLIVELERIEWRGKRTWIVFDSDVASPRHATEFKRSKYSGAIGAEYTLAELLRARGAEVRIVEIPDGGAGEKVGADDYIAHHGSHAFFRLFSTNWCAVRDVDRILYRPRAEAFVFTDSRELVAVKPSRPVFLIDGILPEGGVAVIGAAPKVGKSAVALNAGAAVCRGEKFLGAFGTRQGRAVYIQTEIPAWAMADRLKLMGELPEGLLISTPSRLHLNFYEEHGFKRVETGNAERVAALIEALRQQWASLLILDPFAHFHTLSENKVEDIGHLFEVFRWIARAVPCGILLVHHHRKVARTSVRYEGAEDMRGSIALYAEPDAVISIYAHERADATRRFKLVVSARHCEEPPPFELFRLGGENAMLWRAEPWQDHTKSRLTSEDRLVRALEEGRCNYTEAMQRSGLSKNTFYEAFKRLERKGAVRKAGNLYFLASEEDES